MYNPYNWKIKPKKVSAEQEYEENCNKLHEKYEELRVLNKKTKRLQDEIINLEEKNFNLIMCDDITYDFLLSRIK